MRTSCPHGETTNRSVDGDDPDRPPIGGEGAGHAGSSGGGPPAGLSRRACPVAEARAAHGVPHPVQSRRPRLRHARPPARTLSPELQAARSWPPGAEGHVPPPGRAPGACGAPGAVSGNGTPRRAGGRPDGVPGQARGRRAFLHALAHRSERADALHGAREGRAGVPASSGGRGHRRRSRAAATDTAHAGDMAGARAGVDACASARVRR